MTSDSNSMRADRAFNLANCRVTAWGLHPRTHRTGYCDHHHGEYARTKRRWQSATNNFRRGQSPHDPGPWTAIARNIEFTPQPGLTVTIDEVTTASLQNLATALRRDLDDYTHSGLTQEAVARIWFAHVLDKVLVIRQAADTLDRLALGQQPQLPESP